MDLFHGDLVQNRELARVARSRKNKYHELTVPQGEQDSYLQQGWTLKKQLKNRTRLSKEKEYDELLEDEVWLLFSSMGFIEMNRDRNFKIQAGPIEKQIDVFAKDESNAFIVECKASAGGAQVSRKDIHEISNLKKDITDSIKAKYENRHIRVSFAIATRGLQWSISNEKLAQKNGMFIWKEGDLKSYSELIKHLGVSAKFQIYSILFRNKKFPDLRNIRVPAILGGRGDAKYYSFIITPEELLPFAYVHRRESAPNEVSDSYQRMVKKSRLNKIGQFISKGGYFPNNIILNFTQKPTFHRFEKEKQAGDIVCGMLEFPPYYGSAWIIDGQHRLYGYANNEKRTKDTMPVLAFESLPKKDQANLFVNINEKQVAVTRNLLWDLYPDIYHDSEEKEHQIKRTISLIVKKLNLDSDSALCAHIAIPSMLSKGKEITNLTMTTVCDAVEESRVASEGQMLLYKDDYDSTVDFACERLKAYFDVISKSFPEDWQKGEKGLLGSNIGIRILFIIFRQLMLYLKHGGQEGIYKKKDLSEFNAETKRILSPMLSKLKAMSEEDRSRIRKQTGKGPLTENARQMAWWIKEQFDGFGLQLLRNWAPPRPKELSDDDIRQLLGDTERKLRAFIARELKTLHGEQWWQQGITRGVKAKVDDKTKAETKKTPWKKEELESLAPENKLNFTDTPDLREIIEWSPNWEHFKHLFIEDKEYTGAQFKSFEFVRNRYQHFSEDQCDEIVKNLGYWGMRWIRKCIGLEESEEAR